MQELFLASLLQIARDDTDDLDKPSKGDGDLDKYRLWRVIKREADILREDLGKEDHEASAEQVPGLNSVQEPHPSRADIFSPFPVSSRGWMSRGAPRVAEVQPRDMQPGVGNRRLTPQDALMSLTKVQKLADKTWDQVPAPVYDYL